MSESKKHLFLTPPQLAKKWRVSPGKILGLIASGELRAINFGNGPERPRWRITAEAEKEFLESRTNSPPKKSVVRKRRRKPPKEYL